MLRRLCLIAFVLLSALPAVAQTCDLSMEVTCTPGTNGSATCTSTTTNNGGACRGALFSGWFADDSTGTVHISTPDTSIHFDECWSSDDFGEYAEGGFAFCYSESGLIGAGTKLISTVQVRGDRDIPLLAMTWVGDYDTGAEYGSVYAFVNAETPTCTPLITAPPITQSGVEYSVSWSPVSDPSAQYIVEESTTPDFTANVVQSQVNGLTKAFRHDLSTTTTYYYRVRPTNCTGGAPGVSQTAQTVVQAASVVTPKNAEITLPLGSTEPVFFQIRVPPPAGIASAANVTYTASMDKPFLGVNPKNGTFPAEGLTLTITARPDSLPAGASTGTLTITTQTSSNGVIANAGAPINIPVSISLVTPVTPGKKTLPPANAMIIPVVTHVNGASAPFLSDVRLTNGGTAPQQYQVTMTPTRTNGTTSSKVTQLMVDGLSTIALNDIVKNFFGLGATPNPNDFGFGSLEIRPLNNSSALSFASSRTYANTVRGTFGQFIAAVPFSRFATQRIGIPVPNAPVDMPSTILSLQHVSHSAKFRTNLGIVEGAGEPASGRIRIFDHLGQLLKEIPFALQPGEHQQMDRFIQLQGGITSLENGRIEIVVDSESGAVTGYASVIDNTTSDPLAVMPVSPETIQSTRFVVPGVAELPDGVQNFHSDVRLFNGGPSDVQVNATYYPQGNGPAVAATRRTVRAGETLVLDNILPALFNVSKTGGSVVFTTDVPASLVATGRTFTSTADGGSFGQFIPGVTPEEGVGLGDRPLQILQLEESDRFRSNIGLAELTGNPVTVKLTMHFPDTKTTAITEVQLAANEFRQLGRFIPNPTYNARITVEVSSGNGRVTAYGSVIDNESKDPTYVPAQ